MSNTRQPLLTEEQIQEMLEYARKSTDTLMFLDVWLVKNNRLVRDIVDDAGFNPVNVGEEKFLAFLRGKTKRVLNLDRLRAAVKAWVDDPNRKYPEWAYSVYDQNHFEAVKSIEQACSTDSELCMFALCIGINPDDYFEEVEVEDGVQH